MLMALGLGCSVVMKFIIRSPLYLEGSKSYASTLVVLTIAGFVTDIRHRGNNVVRYSIAGRGGLFRSAMASLICFGEEHFFSFGLDLVLMC